MGQDAAMNYHPPIWPPPTATFPCMVWTGRWWILHPRGIPTASLEVSPGRIRVTPTWFGSRLHLVRSLDYAWPAVVVDLYTLLHGTGLLVDIDGRLGRIVVFLFGRRVVDALRSAGFEVIVIRRRGLNPIRPLTAAEAGSHVDRLPASVISGRG
jgi:hypothetical protein